MNNRVKKWKCYINKSMMNWSILLYFKKVLNLIIFGIVFLNPLKNKLSKRSSSYLISWNWNKIGRLENVFLAAISFMIIIIIVLFKMEIDNSQRKFSEIEDKSFFLNDTIVYFLNCVIEILSYLIIILSLTDFFRMFAIITFVTLNYFQSEQNFNQKFFSWKDKYIRYIFANYLILWCLFPYFNLIDKIRYSWERLSESFKDSSFEALNGIIKSIKGTPFGSIIYTFIEIITASTSTASLAYFSNMYYNEKINFFQSFWNNINSIENRVEGFKFFFKTQISISDNDAINNKKKKFAIVCYESFDLIPNFAKKIYINEEKTYSWKFLEKIENIKNFISQIEKNIEIDKEKKFILYSLFNDYKSFEELEKNRLKLDDVLNANFNR